MTSYFPTVPPVLRVEKWTGRYAINNRSFLKYFIQCASLTPEHPSYSDLLISLSTDSEFLFNPHSPFGKAVLKLSPYSRFCFILANWSQNTVFLMSVTERRIRPLLKSKKRLSPITPSSVINFIPPLYLPPPIPPPQYFHSLHITLSANVIPVHSPSSAGPSVGLPRQGIG